jgi:predicted dehydrogenase
MIRLQAEGFIDGILRDLPTTPSGQDGLKALKVILAAEESASRGIPVPIKL